MRFVALDGVNGKEVLVDIQQIVYVVPYLVFENAPELFQIGLKNGRSIIVETEYEVLKNVLIEWLD